MIIFVLSNEYMWIHYNIFFLFLYKFESVCSNYLKVVGKNITKEKVKVIYNINKIKSFYVLLNNRLGKIFVTNVTKN